MAAVAAALGLTALAGAPPAEAHFDPFKFAGDTEIGFFLLLKDRSLGAAIKTFGPPTTSKPGSRTCVATWRGYAMTFTFSAAAGPDPCSRDSQFVVARIAGEMWRTGGNLAVGDPLARLQSLYPAARLHGDGYWLITRRRPGDGAYGSLRALLGEDERVDAFVVHYPAGSLVAAGSGGPIGWWLIPAAAGAGMGLTAIAALLLARRRGAVTLSAPPRPPRRSDPASRAASNRS